MLTKIIELLSAPNLWVVAVIAMAGGIMFCIAAAGSVSFRTVSLNVSQPIWRIMLAVFGAVIMTVMIFAIMTREKTSQLAGNSIAQIDMIEGEDEIYSSVIKTRNRLNAKTLKSTVLNPREGITEPARKLFKAMEHWYESDQIIEHKKVMRMDGLKALETAKHMHQMFQKYGDANSIRYLRPEDIPAVDVGIFDENEVHLLFPYRKNQNAPSFAIRIRSAEIARAVSLWYSNNLWDTATPLTDEEFTRLEMTMAANADHPSFDDAKFIRDVTFPDGTEVPAGTRFEKIWEIQNAGTMFWQKRYLREVGTAPLGLVSDSIQVIVPNTPPRGVARISAWFTAPAQSGVYYSHWKMIDSYGRFCFLAKKGVYINVKVVDAPQHKRYSVVTPQ